MDRCGSQLHTRRGAIAGAIVALLTLAAAEVRGDARAAHASFAEATALYRQGAFAAAAATFELAFDQGGPPVCLYNAADAAERANLPGRAEALWRRYLRLVDGEERRVALARLSSLTTRPSVVTVHSQPPGAELELDGKASHQRTPARLTIRPGTHRLVVRLAGHEPVIRQLELAYGQPLSLELSLRPLPTMARLQVSSEPAAEVLLDGVSLGQTPIDSEVTAGLHRLELRAAGRLPQARQVRLAPLERATLHLVLDRRPRWLRAGALAGVAITPAVEGLGTGARIEAHLRLEPWSLPVGVGLDLGFSPLQGGLITTLLACLSLRLTPVSLLDGRLAVRAETGVGYAWLHLSNSPLFSGGRNGDLSTLAVGARVLVTFRLRRGLELLVNPVGLEMLAGRFDLPSSITRVHLGAGLGGMFSW